MEVKTSGAFISDAKTSWELHIAQAAIMGRVGMAALRPLYGLAMIGGASHRM